MVLVRFSRESGNWILVSCSLPSVVLLFAHSIWRRVFLPSRSELMPKISGSPLVCIEASKLINDQCLNEMYTDLFNLWLPAEEALARMAIRHL